MQIFEWQGAKLKLERFPTTSNKSLRPWSAAEELMLEEGASIGFSFKPLLFHDQFGFLAVAMDKWNPQSVVSHFSQKTAVENNIKLNTYTTKAAPIIHTAISENLTPCKMAMIRVPKSMDLFAYYLQKAAANLPEEGVALAGFMTRNFTPKMVALAETYFGEVAQSMAKKKARVLVLRKPKAEVPAVELVKIEHSDGQVFSQYPGVFSAEKIDIASQFFMDNWKLPKNADSLLDLASGNGVLAFYLQKALPEAQIHCVDDSLLAISSSKINVPSAKHHWANDLSKVTAKNFDLIVCNPPFHFEYENTIDIALAMFASAVDSLKVGGILQIVANRHLNYTTHLRKLFPTIQQIAENDKFEIIECMKA